MKKVFSGFIVAFVLFLLFLSIILECRQVRTSTVTKATKTEDEIKRVVSSYTWGNETLYTPTDEWGRFMTQNSYLQIKEYGNKKGSTTYVDVHIYLYYFKNQNFWELKLYDDCWPQTIRKIEIFDEKENLLYSVYPAASTAKIICPELSTKLKNKETIKIRVLSTRGNTYGITCNFSYDEKIEWWLFH